MTAEIFQVSQFGIVAFLLVLARVGGLMIFAPFLGSLVIPIVVRVALTFTLSLALFPVLETKVPELVVEPVPVIMVMFSELMIGMLLGLVGQVILGAFRMAGQIMGIQMGFSMARLVDPQTGFESGVMVMFENLVAVMVFLAIDAHHWFIQAVAQSYDVIGPASMSESGAVVVQLMPLMTGIFVVGFKVAAPVTLVLIIVDVLFGVIGRAAPQIQILVVGIPLKPLIGFLLLMGTAQTQLFFAHQYLAQIRQQLQVFLQIMK